MHAANVSASTKRSYQSDPVPRVRARKGASISGPVSCLAFDGSNGGPVMDTEMAGYKRLPECIAAEEAGK